MSAKKDVYCTVFDKLAELYKDISTMVVENCLTSLLTQKDRKVTLLVPTGKAGKELLKLSGENFNHQFKYQLLNRKYTPEILDAMEGEKVVSSFMANTKYPYEKDGDSYILSGNVKCKFVTETFNGALWECDSLFTPTASLSEVERIREAKRAARAASPEPGAAKPAKAKRTKKGGKGDLASSASQILSTVQDPALRNAALGLAANAKALKSSVRSSSLGDTVRAALRVYEDQAKQTSSMAGGSGWKLVEHKKRPRKSGPAAQAGGAGAITFGNPYDMRMHIVREYRTKFPTSLYPMGQEGCWSDRCYSSLIMHLYDEDPIEFGNYLPFMGADSLPSLELLLQLRGGKAMSENGWILPNELLLNFLRSRYFLNEDKTLLQRSKKILRNYCDPNLPGDCNSGNYFMMKSLVEQERDGLINLFRMGGGGGGSPEFRSRIVAAYKKIDAEPDRFNPGMTAVFKRVYADRYKMLLRNDLMRFVAGRSAMAPVMQYDQIMNSLFNMSYDKTIDTILNGKAQDAFLFPDKFLMDFVGSPNFLHNYAIDLATLKDQAESSDFMPEIAGFGPAGYMRPGY